MASSAPAQTPSSTSGVDRLSVAQRVDDSARAAAQEALESLLAGNERFRQVISLCMDQPVDPRLRMSTGLKAINTTRNS